MQRTTTWLLSLALLLAVALPNSMSLACDLCGLPDTVACVHPDLFEAFQTGGGGDDPAPYVFGGSQQGWTTTSGGSSPYGEEAILTWSVVPDGTTLPTGVGEPVSPSSLIAFLDGIHHGGPGPGGSDLTQRAWFPLMKSAFDRWDAVSAIRFTHSPQDDGVTLGSFSGVNGIRGDHRIGGHHLDGTTSPTFVAYNFFPNNADMVIDTDEVGRMGNPGNNFVLFRNTLMHEIGHGLGLNHPASSDSKFLMEAILDGTIDGPQLDDILGIHRLYGDRYEEFGGNDTAVKATNLGLLSIGQSIKLGEDAVDKVVAPTDVDFVSINMAADTDYYKVSLAEAGKLSIVLTPLGPTYKDGPNGGTQVDFVSAAQSDLSLRIYDSTGLNLLANVNSNGLGGLESLLQFPADAANYFIRVSGLQDAAQFYQLDIALVPEPAGFTLLAFGIVALGSWRQRSI